MSAVMLEQIRAAIVAELQAVPDMGPVHNRERYQGSGDWVKAFYTSSIGGAQRVRGWYVHRLSTARSRIGSGRADVTHTWLVRGFCALEDATQTEIDFDALIEAATDRFWGNQNLGINGLSTAVDGEAGLQLQDSGPVLLGNVLCHSARLILRTRHTE